MYPQLTIDDLPDEVLLDIFKFYLDEAWAYDAWHYLVHVCQRWRCLVFASPRRLDLELFCTNRRPVKKRLDIWPALPIVIYAKNRIVMSHLRGSSNIISALKQRDRVFRIDIDGIPTSLLKRFAEIKTPFPVLRDLMLLKYDENAPILPDSFLGGSAPCLEELTLERIPFPALPKLLLSTTNLVDLSLRKIPQSGYISPKAMVTCLSGLTRLNSLEIQFQSPQSRAGQESRHPPPPTRANLPALTKFYLSSDAEYLEDLVSQIDTPLLEYANISFPVQLEFDTPLLRHFIDRTETFKALHNVDVVISRHIVYVTLFRSDKGPGRKLLELQISCDVPDWRFSSLARICNSRLPPFPTLERLEICAHQELRWQDDVQNTQWLQLFRPFSSVKDLTLFGDLVGLIAPVLQELAGESITGVLPALQNLFLRAPWPSKPDRVLRGAIKQFIAARQLSGRPPILHYWVDRRERRREGVTGNEWVVLNDEIGALSAPRFPAL